MDGYKQGKLISMMGTEKIKAETAMAQVESIIELLEQIEHRPN